MSIKYTKKVVEKANAMAGRVMNQMNIDYGKMIARFYGQDSSDMSDEDSLKWGRFGQKMNWPEECPECGQSTKNLT